MKSFFFSYCLLFFATLQGQNNFTLHGLIENFEEGNIFLIHALTRDTIAKTALVNGYFTLSGNVADSSVCETTMLMAKQNKAKRSLTVPFPLEKGTLIFAFSGDGKPMYAGTANQCRFNAFVDKIAYLEKSLKNTATTHIDSVKSEIALLVDAFVEQNSRSALRNFAVLLTTDLIQRHAINAADLPHTNMLCQAEQAPVNDLATQMLCSVIEKSKLKWIGQNMLPFSAISTEGKEIKVNYTNNKYTIIDFWATWCAPCIKKFRELDGISNKQVQIISVSIDDNETVWKQKIQQLNLPWIHLWDKGQKVKELYQVFAVPTTIVIDKQGVIIARNPNNLIELVNGLGR